MRGTVRTREAVQGSRGVRRQQIYHLKFWIVPWTVKTSLETRQLVWPPTPRTTIPATYEDGMQEKPIKAHENKTILCFWFFSNSKHLPAEGQSLVTPGWPPKNRHSSKPPWGLASPWLSYPMSTLGLPKLSLPDGVFLIALPPAAGPNNTHGPMPDRLSFIIFCEWFVPACRQLFLLILLLFSF